MKIESRNIKLYLNEKNLKLKIVHETTVWESIDETPKIILKDGSEVLFTSADLMTHQLYTSGVGKGILSTFKLRDLGEFKTLIWIEETTGHIHFELIPVVDFKCKEIDWPVAFKFEERDDKWLTLLTQMQGTVIPNTWEKEIKQLHFDGQFCSNAAYMPWFAQLKENSSYQMIGLTPWDMAYRMDHPANGPYTHLSLRHLASLGTLRYRRESKLILRENSDIVKICKDYRAYVKEIGLWRSLEEKAARNPNVNKLIGSMFLHKGIKTHVCENSIFYDKEHPEKNDVLVTFKQREQEIKHFKEKGIEKCYLHLDGWGNPGYDNQHPDYLPACSEAGGWEGFKSLSDTMKECNYMFGLHDQYRDYYFDAKTFDPQFACQYEDGSILDVARWAGGRQSYLCASQVPYYVKRNFEEVLAHGIHLEASYLDVFTCNEPDECFHPMHQMTRRECLEYREKGFQYLISKDILPSSEECGDWAMRSLVFAHYGPYDFMLEKPGTPRNGYPVPLFNLVYHDCVIFPWPMDILENGEDYMLYALLNGGGAYVDKDGAYPNVDGAFDHNAREKALDEEIRRYQVVAKLQEKVAKLEMTNFEWVDHDPYVQRSTFADGTSVTINLHEMSYEIK